VTQDVLWRRGTAERTTPQAAAQAGEEVSDPFPSRFEKLSEQAIEPATTKQQVANDDLWTIHGVRYDMRKFIDRHPGGAHAINLGRGIDCTTLFETYHPFTDRHRKVLAAYRYDACPDPELLDNCFDWQDTPFYDELKRAARAYFSPRGDETDHEVQQNSKASSASWLRHSVGMSLLLVAFYGWLKGSWGSLLLFPVLYWVVASDFMHNGSHFAMSTIPWVNAVSGYIGSFHVQVHCWDLQHVVGHHCYTNVAGKDPDLCHFTHSAAEGLEPYLPGFRVSREQVYLPKYGSFWKFAVSFHLVITTFAIAVLNIPKWLTERSVEVTGMPERLVPSIKRDRALLIAACVLFVATRTSIGDGIFTLFWSWAVHGALFLTFSQISHVNEECMDHSETYRKTHKLERLEWARHQLLSAYDYSCDSTFWAIASINLNQQICHHLFPSVHPCHYPALRKLFIPIAQKYGIDYEARSSDTFVQAAGKALGWIHDLNESSDDSASSPARRIFGISASTFSGVLLTVAALSLLFVRPAILLYAS
jgi:fatty acid desaturase